MPRRAAICLFAAAALITCALSYQLQQRVLRKAVTHHGSQINDLERWLVLVPRFVDDRIDFVTDTFPNPPVTLLFLYPLAKLPPAWAQVAWAWSKLGMGIAIFSLALGMARSASVPLTPAAQGLILGVWLWPLMGDLQAGQTNLLMLLPLVAGLRVAQRETPGTPWAAGLLIALATAIKVTPVIFLAYALFRRRWRLASAIALGLLVWLVVVPALVFGWEQNWRWLGQWTSIMVTPYVLHGQVEYFTGQSLPSMISRLLRHVPAFVTSGAGRADEPEPHYVNVADLPEPVVGWIIRGVLLAVALGGAVWARRPLASLRSRRYVLEVGAVAALMLWGSQRTWMEHYVAIALTLLAAGVVLSDAGQPEAIRRRAGRVLAVSVGLMALTSDVVKVVAADGGHYVRTLGVPFWVSVLLVSVIVTARAEAAPAPGEDRVGGGDERHPA